MNRRDLIKRGPLALLGIVGIAAGVRTESPPKPQTIDVLVSYNGFNEHIVKVITDDYKKGGMVREAIQRDRQWGL